MSIRNLKIISVVLVALVVSFLQRSPSAQGLSQSVTVFQYRQVPAEHVSEFLFRETTYWSKVAKKAIDGKKMTFWALLEQVGGINVPSTPNYLFINTFPDVDAVGDAFNTTGMFPGVPMEAIDTNAISTTTGSLYLHMEDMTTAAGVVPDRDFKFVAINYHNSSNSGAFTALERQVWLPFIKSSMDHKQTPQLGWTNGTLIAPRSEDIKFNSVSFDLFPSLQKTLMPDWAAEAVFPTEGLTKLDALRVNPMATSVYRIVQIVSAN